VRRLWRWLTCGHGRHLWQIGAGIDLRAVHMHGYRNADYSSEVYVIVARSCPRCGLVEVLE
jgi:hypothetical protein